MFKKGHFEDIFDRKVALLDYKSIDIKKLQNLRCPKSPWLVHGFYLVKTLKFLYLEFFWQNFRKKCFGDILDRKIAFLQYKNIQDFGQTWKFSFFSFQMLKSVWWRAIDREVAYLNYKDIAFIKKVAKFAFFKGVSSKFWAKIWNFFTHSFWAKWAEKKCLMTFLTEN